MDKFEVTLGQYKGLTFPKADTEPTEEEIDRLLQNEQKSHAVMNEVEEPAQSGDTVVIDFAGFVDDVQFEGGTAEKYSLQLGSGSFIPGFEDQLIGSVAGADVDVHVTFPENYGAENLAGKPALFRCKVHQVQRAVLAPLDDTFAQVNYNLENLAQLREVARRSIAKQKSENAKAAAQNVILEKLLANSQVTLTDEYVEQCITQRMNSYMQDLANQGITLEDFLAYSGLSREELREQFRKQAETGAKINAILVTIGNAEGLVVTEERVDQEISAMADAYEMELEVMKEHISEENRNSLRDGLLSQQALQLVLDATVEE